MSGAEWFLKPAKDANARANGRPDICVRSETILCDRMKMKTPARLTSPPALAGRPGRPENGARAR
jgi:hypothetical protein